MVSEVLASGKSVRDVERIVERPDGSSLIVSVNIDPLRDSTGDVVGVVNCFLDITERKRMDNALERSRLQALEQEQRFRYVVARMEADVAAMRQRAGADTRAGSAGGFRPPGMPPQPASGAGATPSASVTRP